MQPYHFKLHGTPLHYDLSGQMFDDLRRRAKAHLAAQAQAKKNLQTVAQFESYRAETRAHLWDALGGLPSEKTPLNARTTGVIEEVDFTIEKVLFESQPGYIVSALCYLPRQREEQAPAVLLLCGHTKTGKAGYQHVCRDLTAGGFVVFVFDPIGQGERCQYLLDGVNTQHWNTEEHSYAGLPFLLQGASVARHFVWDAVRGIDYLIERGDIDPQRIGMTGNSGGGTQTALLALLEPRIAAAMPCTWITSLEHMMQTGYVQDLEQIVYGAMLRGPDHDDYLTGIAPRPMLLGVAAWDPFPIEGSLQSFERASKVYELYDQPQNMQIIIDQAPQELRVELNNVLGVSQAGNREPPIYARLWPGTHENYAVQDAWFFSAPEVIVGGALFFPTPQPAKVLSTVLLLLENGTPDLPENMELVEKCLQQQKAVFAFDPRGIGAVTARSVSASEAGRPNDPTFAAEFPFYSTAFKMGCDAMMMGISTMGLRVFDILRAFDYLRSRGDCGNIEIYGIGKAAIWSYFAAALEEDIASITCVDMLTSYRQLCQTRFYDAATLNLDIAAWGLLRCGDLEDFLPCIEPRPLQMITSRDREKLCCLSK